MKLSLIETTDGINKLIDSIQRRGQKLDRDIQVAAVSAMAHHDKHGDVTLVNKLIEAMPKGSRVNALREFIDRHGKVRYCPEAKMFLHDKTRKFDLAGATSVMWTEFKPEQAYKPITDPYAAVKRMVTSFEKDRALQGEASTVSAELIDALNKAMSNAIEAEVMH